MLPRESRGIFNADELWLMLTFFPGFIKNTVENKKIIQA